MGKDQLQAMRHSLAHIAAQAVQRIWPEAKFGVGPVIENGFYYDIDLGDVKISESDFGRIEKEMKKIIKQNYTFDRSEMTIEEAIDWAKQSKQPYKAELLEDLRRDGTTNIAEIAEGAVGVSTNGPSAVESVSFYTSGDFTDLCRGPHVERTGDVGAFKLMSLAGAYWRGSEKNPQMQRLYGAAFAAQEDLEAYLERLEQAKLRDHRKLGQELELYYIDEMSGKGLVSWLPNGALMRDAVEDLAKEKELAYGYQRVATPHLAKEELFLTSGHLPYYQGDMYPAMKMDDGTYYLKAMNCPHHHRIYQYRQRSYKELPLRLAEYGTCYRNELSGTLAGLLRVRGMSMNDGHIYCTREQVKDEFRSVIELTQEYFSLFGLQDYWFRLSKWSPDHTDKYIDEPENWQYTQDALREVLEAMKLPFQEVDDEAAFYGPKVDVQFTSVSGREETMSTIQLDFAAKTRFGLEYVGEDGDTSNDVFVIHRAPLSVHERFMAFLIEHYAGRFPVWLSPEQLRIIQVKDTEEIAQCASDIYQQALSLGIRATVDDSNETVGKKIRSSATQKVPYTVVVGEREATDKQVTPRIRADLQVNDQESSYKIDHFLSSLNNEIRSRASRSSL